MIGLQIYSASSPWFIYEDEDNEQKLGLSIGLQYNSFALILLLPSPPIV